MSESPPPMPLRRRPESPLRRIEVFKEHLLNRKSKSPLRAPSRRFSIRDSPYSSTSLSPLRNIRQRSNNYKSLGDDSKSCSALQNAVPSPEASDDFKENIIVPRVNLSSDSLSPSSVDSTIPIHPLQFSIQEHAQHSHDSHQTPISDCEGTPSSVGQPSVSNSRYPSSSDLRFLRPPPASQYRSISDTRLIKKSQEYGRKLEPPLKIGGNPSIPSNRRSQLTKGIIDESSDWNYPLGSLDERPQILGLSDSICSDSSFIFSSNLNDGGNEFDRRDSMKSNTRRQNAKHQDDFQQIMSCNRSASELRGVCSSMTTTDDLLKAQSFLFGMSLRQASERDYKGETVLHGFSNNKALAAIIGNPNNEEYETKNFLTLYRQPTIDQNSTEDLNNLVESFLVDKLLPSFFGAPIAQDKDGQIPFEAALIDWVATCHKEMYTISPQCNAGYFTTYTHKVSDVVTSAWESTTARAFGRASSRPQRQGAVHNDIERGDSMSSTTGSTMSQSFGKSKLTPHARFCLRMLSLILDEFDKFTEGFKAIGMDHQMEKYSRAIKGIQQLKNVTGPLDLCGRVVEKVASIPHLLEVVFSINNESDLEFVLSTKIIKRVLVDKHSIGPWLTTMLQSPQRHVSRRAIDYLQTVSSLCSREQNEHEKNKKDELESESVDYDDLIDEVSRLHNFIPSLLALEEKDIEEVSTTLIVKAVMDKMIARPFVATVIFFDAIFLFLMIFGFRAAVNGIIMGTELDTVLTWIYVANTGIFYFIIAEIGKFVSLFLLSKHSRNYILSFWNLIDVLAILLAAISSVTMRWQFTIGDELTIKNDTVLRGLLAVTTGFLWLRVLNLLKAINMQLATFVLAILQITKDIFWFCIILLALIVSFSQMFFTLMAPPSCATTEDTTDIRECKQNEYLLSVYTILLGDFGLFERDDFVSGVSVFLVVLYSFLVTVVLLNVLIAVASDSYEKCLLKSQKLFGRARVMLIAELASFQSLLRRRDQDAESSESLRAKGIVYSKWWTSNGLSHNWSRGSVLFFWLSMIVTICWTFAELVGYIRGVQVGSISLSFASVFVNIAVYITIIVFLDRNSAANSATKNEPVDASWSNSYQKLVHWILGVSRRSKKVSSRFSRGEDVWHGRVEFLQREMDRNTEKQKEFVMAQSESLQNFMNASETRVRTEINQIDEKFKLLHESMQDELEGTREVNARMLSAVNELRVLISMAEGSTAGQTSAPGIPNEVDVSEY